MIEARDLCRVRIFLSYRRSDSTGHIGRLYDRLVAHFGRAQIFRDRNDIESGAHFPETIARVLEHCVILLAVIGPGWLGADDGNGRRRLDDPDDFVVREIARSLARNILVIPVLLGGAVMPKAEQLPASIRLLAEQQAHELHEDPAWEDGVARLLKRLEQKVAPAAGLAPPLDPQVRIHQLPADLPDFIDREKELEVLVQALDCKEVKGVPVLGGMGGLGKTALAVHAAHRVKDRFPDGQIVVDLKGAGDQPLTPAEAMAQVLRSFLPESQLPEEPRELASFYRHVLHGRRVLLFLDNVKDAGQVRDLLPSPPGAALLTSRRRRLPLPGISPLDLEALSPEDALSFLRGLLGVDRGAATELEALAQLCGYLPLALRVAGSFIAAHPDWTVSEYLEDLQQERLRLLGHEDLEVEVEAVLGLSAATLSRERPDLAARWQMLTVFPESLDREAAAAVWQISLREAREALSDLTVRSLLLFDETSRRYRFHDLMRLVAVRAFAYGGGNPDPAAEAQRLEETGARHASYFLEVLEQSNKLFLEGGEALIQGLVLLDREWANIRAGQLWAAVRADTDAEADRICTFYPVVGSHVLKLRLPPRELLPWLEAGLTAARRLKDPKHEAIHLRNLGTAFFLRGDFQQSIEYQKKSLALAREIGDRHGEGCALCNLGVAYEYTGEYQRAIDYQEESLLIAREIGDRREEGISLNNLGNAYCNLGEYQRSIEYHEKRLDIAREIGDRLGEGSALCNLGEAYNILKEYQRAITYHEQALAIFREIGHRWGEGVVIFNLAQSLEALGDIPQAIAQAQQALEIFQAIEAPNAGEVLRQLEVWRGQGG